MYILHFTSPGRTGVTKNWPGALNCEAPVKRKGLHFILNNSPFPAT